MPAIEWVGTTPDELIDATRDRFRITWERRRLAFGLTWRPDLCCWLWDKQLIPRELVPIDTRPVCDDSVCIIDVKPARGLNGAGAAWVAQRAREAAGPWARLLRVEKLSPSAIFSTQPEKQREREAWTAEGVGDRGGVTDTLRSVGEAIGDVGEATGRALGSAVGGVFAGLWPFLLVGGLIAGAFFLAQSGRLPQIRRALE